MIFKWLKCTIRNYLETKFMNKLSKFIKSSMTDNDFLDLAFSYAYYHNIYRRSNGGFTVEEMVDDINNLVNKLNTKN